MNYATTIKTAIAIAELNRLPDKYELMIATIVKVAHEGDVKAIKDANLIPVIKACIPPSLLGKVMQRIEVI